MPRQLCPGSQVFEGRGRTQPANRPRILDLHPGPPLASMVRHAIAPPALDPAGRPDGLQPVADPRHDRNRRGPVSHRGRRGGTGPGTGGFSGLGGSKVSAGARPAACNALIAEYQSALTAAETCQVGASGQCQQIATGALSGCSCQTYVTDSSALSVIEEDWQAAGCAETTTACVSGCPAALNTTCVPTDGGSVGFCSYVPGTGGTSGNDGTGGMAVARAAPPGPVARRWMAASAAAARSPPNTRRCWSAPRAAPPAPPASAASRSRPLSRPAPRAARSS